MAKERKKVTTPTFRVSFPNLFEAKSFEGGEAKFGLTMLFDDGADLSELKALAKAAAKEKWGDAIPKSMRSPFRDGAEKPDLDGYEGVVFCSATSKVKPGVVDQSLQPILDSSELYAGCYARASVTAYAYDTKGNKGVAFGLLNVQKIKDGEPFSGRSKPEDDFAPVAGEAGGDSDLDDLFEDDDLHF